MTETKSKAYDVLCQDRRYGLDLYLKGVAVFLALYGVGIKQVLEATDPESIAVVSVSGLAILGCAHVTNWKSWRFGHVNHEQIRTLCEELGFQPPYRAVFLYLAGWGLVTVLTVVWCIAGVSKWLSLRH